MQSKYQAINPNTNASKYINEIDVYVLGAEI